MLKNDWTYCYVVDMHFIWMTQHVTSEAEHSHSLYRPVSQPLYIYIWSWFALISRFCVSICICICRNDILLLLLGHHYIFVVCYCYRYHYNRKAEMKCFVDLCLMEIHHCLENGEWSGRRVGACWYVYLLMVDAILLDCKKCCQCINVA